MNNALELYFLITKNKDGEHVFVEGGGSSTKSSPKVYKDRGMAQRMRARYSRSMNQRVWVSVVRIAIPEYWKKP